MQFKQSYNKLIESKLFKDWIKKKENSDYFIAHGFILLDELNRDVWQIGYYSKSKDKIVTFLVDEKEIKASKEAAVFKKPEAVIKKLDIKKVNIDLKDVLEIAEKLRKDKYPSEEPQKIFMILQKCGKDQIFNVTFITKTMKILNIRVDSSKGKVIRHKISTLFSFIKE